MGAGASGDRRSSIHVQHIPQHIPSQQRLSLPEGAGGSAGSHLTTADPLLPGFWVYEEAPNDWKPFAADASERLEEAYASQEREGCQVVVVNRVYSVSFHTGVMRSGNISRRVDRISNSAKGRHGDSVSAMRSRAASVDPFSVAAIDATFSGAASASQREPRSAAEGEFDTSLLSGIVAHSSPVYGCMFDESGENIVTGAKDGTLKFWETKTGFLIEEKETHPGSILSCAIHPKNPLRVATGCEDGIVRVFDVRPRNTQPCTAGSDSDLEDELAPADVILVGHAHKVYGVSWQNDGKGLVSAAMDCELRLWDVERTACVRCVDAHRSSIFALQTSRLSSWLAITASDDCTLAAHDLRLQSTVVARFTGHTKTLWGCDIRYDDGQYLSCGMDNEVRCWDPRRFAEPLLTITSHANPVHSVEYLPDGRHFLSSSRDQSFKLSSASSGRSLLSVQAHEGHVFKVTYNAPTASVMTCGTDAVVKLWKLHER